MRKGTKVIYKGSNELMQGQVYTIHRKSGSLITIHAPIRYANGEIHLSLCSFPARDFEAAT